MIKATGVGHYSDVNASSANEERRTNPGLGDVQTVGLLATGGPRGDRAGRLRRAISEYSSFVWRVLRRFSVPESDADDATQEVFVVLANKIEQLPIGAEKSFLFRTAVLVASHARRGQRRRKEDTGDLPERIDSSPDPEETLAKQQRLALLDLALETLPDEFRQVFVLCELEQMTMAEVSQLIDIAPGTVASRLRRARELFSAAAKNYLQARGETQ